MGHEPSDFVCDQFINNKWYIAELRAFGPTDPPGACGDDWGEIHCVRTGWSLNNWVCNELDMTFPSTLCGALGDCQKLLKVFGPWDTQIEAINALW